MGCIEYYNVVSYQGNPYDLRRELVEEALRQGPARPPPSNPNDTSLYGLEG